MYEVTVEVAVVHVNVIWDGQDRGVRNVRRVYTMGFLISSHPPVNASFRGRVSIVVLLYVCIPLQHRWCLQPKHPFKNVIVRLLIRVVCVKCPCANRLGGTTRQQINVCVKMSFIRVSFVMKHDVHTEEHLIVKRRRVYAPLNTTGDSVSHVCAVDMERYGKPSFPALSWTRVYAMEYM